MCAISGILGNVNKDSIQLVLKMNNVQKHRGPDDGSVYRCNGAVLGHRRLKVIDLSNHAQQPMETENGRYVIVFNGEIYNYKEIRKQLNGRYNFVSESDTEVLLAAYVIWGKDCLERLVGMFAFCIYDTHNLSAFFARDRFGQKPLFISESKDGLCFGSEIKSILATGIPAKSNLETWHRYLMYASYDDDENTFFSGVSQLRPGEMAFWKPSTGLIREMYYNLSNHVNPVNIDAKEATERVKELMVDSCRQHMCADVPIGISLSGGLDSSALLSCLHEGGMLDSNIKCISVDFGRDYSEKFWIESSASHYNLTSQIENFTNQEFYNYIKPMMWHLEAPLGGLMNCGLTKVMRKAKESGIVVMQDGTGLDEAFGGYQNQHNLYLSKLLLDKSHKLDKALHEYAANWGVSVNDARRFAESEGKHRVTAIDGTIPVRPDLLSEKFTKQFYSNSHNKKEANTGDVVVNAFVDYLQRSKIPRNSRMKDRTSMAHGVELRMPFLDHRLIEYALSLPVDYHFMHGYSKSVVRESLKGLMDDSVRLAHKRSVHAPQGLWFKKDPMRRYIIDLIGSESFADRGIFDVNKVKSAFSDYCNGNYNNSFFIWQWINMEEWHRMFIDKAPLHPKNHSIDNFYAH